MKNHHYHLTITWTGNLGEGTKSYTTYERNHTIEVSGKPIIPGTSEVSYKGNQTRYNPEELLVASLSSCHMLWYLHFCAVNGVVVIHYIDKATGTMQTEADGNGRFTEVILQPQITIAGHVDESLLQQLQKKANEYCFIANSCNFPVKHQPSYVFV
ncbi:MAG: OsmC family protein [Bacteroidota bacterium]|nr:OsmC family protein [Bacteroidota bacterium]